MHVQLLYLVTITLVPRATFYVICLLVLSSIHTNGFTNGCRRTVSFKCRQSSTQWCFVKNIFKTKRILGRRILWHGRQGGAAPIPYVEPWPLRSAVGPNPLCDCTLSLPWPDSAQVSINTGILAQIEIEASSSRKIVRDHTWRLIRDHRHRILCNLKNWGTHMLS